MISENKKHIVFITAWFYPVNKVASFRINAFAKYLDKHKFDVSVISYNDDNLIQSETIFDRIQVYREKGTSLFQVRRQKVGENWFVHNLKSLNNKIVLYFSKEDYPGWSYSVLKRLIAINNKQKIDCIISSFAPVDSHVAAYQFKRFNPNVKWIADMRDEMSENSYFSNKTKAKLLGWEKKMDIHLNAVVSVSKPILNSFKNSFFNSSIVYSEIRNGYDHNHKPKENFNKKFTLLFAGTFYDQIKPDFFFKALINLENQKKLGDFWEFILLGTHENFSKPNSLKYHLKILPPVNYDEAINQIFAADCNVLILPSNRPKGVYSGKLFDYISAGKPIIALGDKEDVAANLINDLGIGVVVDFYNLEDIEKGILYMYNLWSKKISLNLDPLKIEALHRKNQTLELENLIEKLCNG